MEKGLTVQYRQVHYERGVLYSSMGQYEQAINSFTKAIDLDPDCTIAYYDRAVAHQHVSEYQAAIDDFQQYLALVPHTKDKKEILETIEKLEEQLRNPKPRKRWIGLTKADVIRQQQEEEENATNAD